VLGGLMELSEELRHQKGAYNGNTDEPHNSGDLEPSPFCQAALKDAPATFGRICRKREQWLRLDSGSSVRVAAPNFKARCEPPLS